MNFWRSLILLVGSGLLWSQALALEIKTWTTENGAKVMFVESHDLPMVDIRFTYKAGSARDGEQPGISRLVSALLVEGTGDLDAKQVALQFESVGAQLGHDSLRDMAWTSLRSLSDPAMLDQVVDLYARVNALPSFPPDAIERDRKSLLVSLANRKNQISNVVNDAFFAQVYAGHAYQIGQQGTEAGLKSITREDLLDFHRRYYVAANATLAMVGDLSEQQARDYAEQLTRHLQTGEAAPALAPAPQPDKAQIVRVPFKTTQSHIVQGKPVLSRIDPDYFPLYVGNHILGGSGFSSRLMQEIRENRGLSYSVYSFFVPMESNGPFEMALQTRNDQVDEAAGLLQQMLEEFIDKGPTAEELEHAKKNITGSFPLKIDSNKKIVDYLAVIGFYDLPLKYLDNFNERVMAVTREDIKDAFARRVDPLRMIRVIVGEQQTS
ncbi:MAG: pitrilysin family protein [Gammaproteobacteria bacterium]|nr:pitrilysin family protein [Gammaproteobacteria bacterium]